MLKMEKFVFNSFQVNTYLVWDPETLEAAIIDPGCFSTQEKALISEFSGRNSLNIKYLLNTHCHIDHVLGNSFIKSKFDSEFFAPEKDLPLLENTAAQGKMFGINTEDVIEPDKFLSEDLQLKLGEFEIRSLFTPGHTPGEFSFLFPAENKCFTGDVLFFESIGRTDLWGGDSEQLLDSLRTKLLMLPNETEIFPGHGPASTIGYEKDHNPFL